MKRDTMWGDVWAAKEILAGSQNLKCFSCRVAFSRLASPFAFHVCHQR